jgi:predicted DNA-binding transcriptional regulator AlpA
MKNDNAVDAELLTATDGAKMLSISLRTFQRLAKEDDFPRALRLGGCVRWEKLGLALYIESLKDKAST